MERVDITANFAINLNFLRSGHGLSQQQSDALMGFAPGSVARLEAGSEVPSLASASTISELFDITLDALLYHPTVTHRCNPSCIIHRWVCNAIDDMTVEERTLVMNFIVKTVRLLMDKDKARRDENIGILKPLIDHFYSSQKKDEHLYKKRVVNFMPR